MNGNNTDEHCRNTVVNSTVSENIIIQTGHIDNADLVFVHNNRIKKYLISDYFTRVIANKVVTIQESGTNEEGIDELTSEYNIESAEESEIRKNQTIQTIKNKNYVQQHILKRPRANDTWDSCLDTRNESSIRIYFQNISGLMMGSKANRWTEHIENMMNMGCDISGLAESNTNWNNNKVKRTINKIAADSYQNVSSSLSKNRFQPDNTSVFLPGGTIQTCVNHWTGRIIKVTSDPRKLGQWSGHQFRLQDEKFSQ